MAKEASSPDIPLSARIQDGIEEETALLGEDSIPRGRNAVHVLNDGSATYKGESWVLIGESSFFFLDLKPCRILKLSIATLHYMHYAICFPSWATSYYGDTVRCLGLSLRWERTVL